MTRFRFLGASALFGAMCVLTPTFHSPVAAFGGRCQTTQVCVQYVYVPVYIEKTVYVDRPGTDPTPPDGPKKPKIHFFMVMDTDDLKVGLEIEATENKMRQLYSEIPEAFRGQIKTVDARKLTRSKVLEDLREFGRRVGKNDTLLVFCNTHGEVAEKVDGKEVRQDDKKDVKQDDKKDGKDEKKDAAGEKKTPEDELDGFQDKKESTPRTDPGQNLIMYSPQKVEKDPSLKDLPESERVLPRKDLINAMNGIDCRLRLLITDACFRGKRGFGAARPGQNFEFKIDDPVQQKPLVPFNELEAKGYKALVLEDLFLNHRGALDLNSSSAGQLATARAFGQSLPALMLGFPTYNSDLTWDAFVNELQKQTNLRLNFVLTQPGFEATGEVLERNNQKDKTGFFQTLFLFTGGDQTKYPTPSKWTRDVGDDKAEGKADEPPTPKLMPMPAPDTGDTPRLGGKRQAAAPAVPAPLAFGAPTTPPVNPAAPRPTPAPAPVVTPTGPPTAGSITVHVPPEAALFLNDTPTKQTTAVRHFQTPTLAPGESVTYTFRAELVVDGAKTTESKEVTLTRGKAAVLAFDKLRAVSAAPTSATPPAPAPEVAPAPVAVNR